MSLMAEQSIIGSLLIDNNCIEKIYNKLTPEMFSYKIIGEIYTEFQKGYERRYAVDIITLEQKFRDNGDSKLFEMLKGCASCVSTSTMVESYANVVIDDYKARRLKEYISSIKISSGEINEQIRLFIEELEVLQGVRETKSKPLPIIVKENKNKYFVEHSAAKINLGFSKLDELLGGLEGGDVIIIGARPAVGKSAFVTQITSNLAKQGKRIGFYNLEMQEKQVYERFVVSESAIGLTRLRRATCFLGDEKERFDRANEVLENEENIVITTGTKAVSEIRAESRHMGYDIIIIDYLQLLRADKTYRGNRYAEVGAISKAIKALAMELNIPIIALSQLNRASEMRYEKEPTMSELREAGDIEQDASVIILMWELSQKDKTIKGCKIEKSRQGETGKITLKFNGDLMRFVETNDTVEQVQSWSITDEETPFD